MIDKQSGNIRRAFERLYPRIQVRKYLFEDMYKGGKGISVQVGKLEQIIKKMKPDYESM